VIELVENASCFPSGENAGKSAYVPSFGSKIIWASFPPAPWIIKLPSPGAKTNLPFRAGAAIPGAGVTSTRDVKGNAAAGIGVGAADWHAARMIAERQRKKVWGFMITSIIAQIRIQT
jgi:hypothetical protein